MPHNNLSVGSCPSSKMANWRRDGRLKHPRMETLLTWQAATNVLSIITIPNRIHLKSFTSSYSPKTFNAKSNGLKTMFNNNDRSGCISSHRQSRFLTGHPADHYVRSLDSLRAHATLTSHFFEKVKN